MVLKMKAKQLTILGVIIILVLLANAKDMNLYPVVVNTAPSGTFIIAAYNYTLLWMNASDQWNLSQTINESAWNSFATWGALVTTNDTANNALVATDQRYNDTLLCYNINDTAYLNFLLRTDQRYNETALILLVNSSIPTAYDDTDIWGSLETANTTANNALPASDQRYNETSLITSEIAAVIGNTTSFDVGTLNGLTAAEINSSAMTAGIAYSDLVNVSAWGGISSLWGSLATANTTANNAATWTALATTNDTVNLINANYQNKSALIDNATFATAAYTATVWSGSAALYGSLVTANDTANIALSSLVTTNNSVNAVWGSLVTTNTTANNALPKAGGTMTGNLDMGANNMTTTGEVQPNVVRFGVSGCMRAFNTTVMIIESPCTV